ncbi:MAG TPA: hypothetical protein VFT39_04815 [Vicinamibacterales bacterium]|nr:hypothetical protein [Vicinamibacterales bacterium]
MDTPLIEAARAWVIDRYPYNRHHLLQALAWLDRVAPDSPEAVRLATLTHDMERAFPGPDQPVIKTLSDPEYERLHSLRSARIVGAWLREQHAKEALVEHVEALIVAHEFGGWPEADLVQAVDSLSFLETNIDLFLGFVRSGKHPAHEVRKKFNSMFGRIQVPRLKLLAQPLVDRALEQLDEVERQVHGVSH